MAINKPKLDDRTYKDLMDEMKSLIPRYNSEYTNFNPSDPGITLLELFAWLADQLLYRLNRISESSYRTMLKIILGEHYIPEESLSYNIKQAKTLLDETYRAITEEDYVTLVFNRMEEIQPGLGGRVIVMNNMDLSFISDNTVLENLKKIGHITVVVIPRCDGDAEGYCNPDFLPALVPSQLLMDDIDALLTERRLISTTVHVVPPSYVPMDVQVWIQMVPNADSEKAKANIYEQIKAYFDPISGGAEGKGWAPGRSFHKSELFQILEATIGVDHVEKTLVKSNDVEVTGNAALKPWEFISLGNVDINIVTG